MNKSPLTIDQRFWSKVFFTDHGCWIWLGGTDADGYGIWTYRIIGGGYSVSVRAPKFAYESCGGVVPVGMILCHKCDVPPCVRPGHLFPGTNSDNMKDAYSKGRLDLPPLRPMFGTENYKSKLNWDLVREIRSEFVSGASKRGLSIRYGVDRSTIQDIITERIWHPSREPICHAL